MTRLVFWGAIALSVFTALALIAGAAKAEQQPCRDRAEWIRVLTDEYGELPQVRGLDGTGGMIEVWASEAGSWTILRTAPDGRACIKAAGEWFSRLAPKFGEPL